MVYLFVKIFLCLLVAAIVGGIIGWLLRGLGFKSRQEEYAACGPRLQEAEDELERLRGEHAGCADKISSLSSRLAAAEKDLEARSGETQPRTVPLESVRPPAPEATVTADGRPGWLLSAPDGEKDDLQKIWGIGPVLEQTLNGLGVFHFRQIAGFSEADIAWVSENVQAFPDRIVRDNWVGQARDLHLEKYGETA